MRRSSTSYQRRRRHWRGSMRWRSSMSASSPPEWPCFYEPVPTRGSVSPRAESVASTLRPGRIEAKTGHSVCADHGVLPTARAPCSPTGKSILHAGLGARKAGGSPTLAA